MFEELDWEDPRPAGQVVDRVEIEARELLRGFFERNRHNMYFSRQLEVQNEDRYFHWIMPSLRYSTGLCGQNVAKVVDQ
jgi:hypothetical protein